MINREDIFNLIPMPRNEDVIIYDTNLKDLLDTNVLEEYEKLNKTIELEKENYQKLNFEIKRYKDTVNNSYLYRADWNEDDYIDILQKEKKQYSNLFYAMKKKQSELDILQRKYAHINEQIEIQAKKDQEEIEEKKKNINNEIETKKNEFSKIEEQIKRLENEEIQAKDFIEFIQGQNEILEKNIEKNVTRVIDRGNTKIKKLSNNIAKLEQLINIQKEKSKTVKKELNNLLQFKEQDFTFYTKKSMRILELEGQREQISNKIVSLKEEINNDPINKDTQYLELKDNIEKIELSLENLKKIKEYKVNIVGKLENFKKIEKTLFEHIEQQKKYTHFLDIYYKIYEQKANDYFGPNIKFKFHEIVDEHINKIIKISYKNINYPELNSIQRENFEQELNEKMKLFL